MSEETEPIEKAPTEAATPRNPLGWVLLTLIIGFLILSAISGSVREDKPKEQKYLAQEMQLRVYASQQEMLRKMVSPANKEDLANVEEQARDSLSETVSDLIPLAQKDARAARLYAVMRTEQGRPVPSDMLDALRRSDDPVDRAYVEIYSNATLSPERAKRLVAKLPDQPFSNVMARVQALEKTGDKGVRSETFSIWYAVRIAVMSVAGCGIFFLSFIVWLAYISGRRRGRFAPRGHPIGRVTLRDADRLAMRAAQILASFLGLTFALGFLQRGGVSFGYGANIVLGLGILVIVALLARTPVQGKRITLNDLGLSFDRFGKNLGWGLVGFLAEVPVTAMMALIGGVLFKFLPTPSHPATEAILDSKDLLSVMPIVFFGSIVAPIWEEILFRGILFPAIGRMTGRIITGALLSSLIFGLIHPQGPALVLALSSVGAMSCGLAYQTRSLVPSIVMHMLHNSAIFAVTLLLL